MQAVRMRADTMSFAGLAPEIINGRAAMIGMLAAFGAEVATHQRVVEQVTTALRKYGICFIIHLKYNINCSLMNGPHKFIPTLKHFYRNEVRW